MSAAPTPSATVVLLRDAPAGLELLLLQRAGRGGAAGPWVFPGGKVEPSDVVRGDAASQASALRAAVRETREEAGLDLADLRLHAISRWITPEISPKRFDTWFFLAAVEGEEAVRVDGSEIVGHRWLPAPAALTAHQAGELRLAPPTFVTVTWVSAFERSAAAIERLAGSELLTFRPRICRVEGGAVMLYPGDAGYAAGEPEARGPRHRLWALAEGYRYERD